MTPKPFHGGIGIPAPAADDLRQARNLLPSSFGCSDPFRYQSHQSIHPPRPESDTWHAGSSVACQVLTRACGVTLVILHRLLLPFIIGLVNAPSARNSSAAVSAIKKTIHLLPAQGPKQQPLPDDLAQNFEGARGCFTQNGLK
jgi:hypothetical protein